MKEQCPVCKSMVSSLAMHKAMGMCLSKASPTTTMPPEAKVEVSSEVAVRQEYRAEEIVSSGKAEESAGVAASDFPGGGNGQYHVFYPKPDPHFITTENISRELEIAHIISQKHPVNLLVTGHPGGGKTSLGIEFASKFNRPCVVVDFGVLQEPQELFHTTRLETDHNGSRTDIRESGFVKGLETEKCVVVLDELNRPENERVLNVLLPFLDGRQSSYIDYLRRLVRVADGVVFIATLNEGAMFCGVSSIDTALRDRFREIHMPYLPPAEEAKVLHNKTGVGDKYAYILADFAARIRNTPVIARKVSTRQLLTAAENFAAGDELWRAVSTSIGHYNDASWRQQVMEVFALCLQDLDERTKWEKNKSAGEKYVQF